MLTFFHPALGQTPLTEASRPVVLYVYDPLCGWCYGFSPVMHRLATEMGQDADFRVISGGMVTGNRVGPLSDIAPYIRKAYQDVERLSGVKFGESYLKVLLGDAGWRMDSDPPSLLHTALVTLFPDRQTEVSAAIQKGIYQQGIEPVSPELTKWVATQFNLTADSLTQKMNSPENQELKKAQYDLSAKLGVTGYPAVLVLKEGKWYLAARGFTDYDQMKVTLKSILN